MPGSFSQVAWNPEGERFEIIELPATCPADSSQVLLKAVADIWPLPSELIVLF